MYRANRNFSFDGEPYVAGITHVADDHPARRAHPAFFEQGNASSGRGARSEIRARTPEGKTTALFTSDEVRGRLLDAYRAGAGERAGESGPPKARRLRDSGPGWEDRERALRTIDQHGEVLSAAAGDMLVNLVERDSFGSDARYISGVGDPHYLSAFGKVITDPTHGHLRHTPEEVEAVRVVSAIQEERGMVGGTGSAGGFALPLTLDPSILLSSNGALNPVREVARVITIGTREWKGVSSDGVTASYDAEASEVSDDTPTLGQPEITTAMGRAFIPFSVELGQDWGSLQRELTKLISDGRDVLDATKFLTGSGTAEPAGVLTGLSTSQRVQTAGSAAFAVGDNYLLKEALPSRFVPNASFVANPTTLDTIYRFVGGGSTEPPVLPQRDGAWLGVPAYEWSTIGTGTSSGTKIGIVGDFSQFVIADRIGMNVEIVQTLFGANRRPTGERGLFAYWRSGSTVAVANAFRYLEVK